MEVTLWFVVLQLIIVDLVLGADNAFVISLATKSLPPELRKKASFIGAILAIALRAFFVFLILVLGELHLPFVNLIAGLLLLKISVDLMTGGDEEHEVKQETTMVGAVKTIVIADAIMSFDNAMLIAVIAASAPVSLPGQLTLVIFALLFSFPVILFAANLLGKLVEKFKVVIYVLSILLIHVSVELIAHEQLFQSYLTTIDESILSKLVWLVALTVFSCAYYFKVVRNND